VTGGAFFNLIKSLLGIGLLTFPFGFSLVGLPLAITTTVVVVLLVRVSMVLLVYVDDAVEGRDVAMPTKRTFPDIVLAALEDGRGPLRGRCCRRARLLHWPTLFPTVVGQLGTCVGYLTFVGSNVHQLLPHVPLQYAVLAAAAAALPASLIPRMRSLYPISVVGMAALLAGLLALGVYCGHDAPSAAPGATPPPSHWKVVHWGGLFRFAGIALFASEGITAIPSIKASLTPLGDARTGTLSYLLDLALATMTAFLLAVGILGWDCLGEHPASVVTQALVGNGGAATAVRALLSIYILCTYPLQLFPAMEALERWLLSDGRGALARTPSSRSGGGGSGGGSDDSDSGSDGAVGGTNGSSTNGSGARGDEAEGARLLTAAGREEPGGGSAGTAAAFGSLALSQGAGAGRIDAPPSHGRAHALRVVADDDAGVCVRGAAWCCSCGGQGGRRRGAYALCTAVLRILAVATSGLLAAQLRSFGVFMSFLGWFAFGVLSFIIPPLMYLTVIGRLYAHRPDALAAGQHWASWHDRLRGAAPDKTEAVAATLRALHDNGGDRDRAEASGARPPTLTVAQPRSGSRSSSPTPFSPPSPPVLVAAAPSLPATSEAAAAAARPWWRSVWFWERAGLYVYIVGGTLATIAGMVMVLYEASVDAAASDSVGSPHKA